MEASAALQELLETVHYIGEDWPDLDAMTESELFADSDEEEGEA